MAFKFEAQSANPKGWATATDQVIVETFRRAEGILPAYIESG
jgi:hypothetical protein